LLYTDIHRARHLFCLMRFHYPVCSVMLFALGE
jgi:hypothetical protein